MWRGSSTDSGTCCSATATSVGPRRAARHCFVFQSYALFKHDERAKNIAFGLRVRKYAGRRTSPPLRRAAALVQLEGLA